MRARIAVLSLLTGLAVAAPAQAVVDVTPPVVTPVVVGTLGTNGWYVSNVGLTWTVTDPDGPILTQTGCGPQSITSDTTGVTFTCSASSAGGPTSVPITIKRDTAKPIVAFAGDNNVPGYTIDQSVTVTCASSDPAPGSGLVANPSCPGSPTPPFALVNNQAAYLLPVGFNTVGPVTVLDQAGNSTTSSTTFKVVANPYTLCLVTQRLVTTSAAYPGLTPTQKTQVDTLVNDACSNLNALYGRWALFTKSFNIARYKSDVDQLVPFAVLTGAQATRLKAIAATL